MFPEIEGPLREYLSAGGRPSSLPRERRPVFATDLTNDGVPELAFEGPIPRSYIFGCEEGRYVTLLNIYTDSLMSYPSFRLVPDANRNGLPEIIADLTFSTGGSMDLALYEWNGAEFRSLFLPDGLIYVGHAPRFTYADTNAESFLEITIASEQDSYETYCQAVPMQPRTDTYKWTGTGFVLSDTTYGPPQYRFEAVLDGDQATLAGDYAAAQRLYQDAIFSDKLDWWSAARQLYLQTQRCGNLGQTASPLADPDEYPNLSAYSRYRLQLLHIARGWIPEAETVYSSLIEKHPPGSPGGVFATLATIFMDAFHETGDIHRACTSVLDAIPPLREDAFKYLSAPHYGWQAPEYDDEDICPF